MAIYDGSVTLNTNEKMESALMFVKLTGTDRVATVVNAKQVTFVSSTKDGTRIRFGEGRSVTVVEPIDEVLERLNRTHSDLRAE